MTPSLPARISPAAVARSPNATPGAIQSRNQRIDPAAESMTDIRCHRPGTAWQNAWTRPSGSYSGASVAANTTPEVPSDSAIRPGATTPVPTAFAAWSPPPATTGVPARRPVASAAASPTTPVTSGPSNVGGIHAGSIPRASSITGDQSRAARSNSTVPDPSALSIADAPVSAYRT